MGQQLPRPFVLTNLLLPTLLEGRAPRVTTMSSIAAQAASIDFADLEWEKKYSSWRAYGQSKLADLLMGLHLAAGARLEAPFHHRAPRLHEDQPA